MMRRGAGGLREWDGHRVDADDRDHQRGLVGCRPALAASEEAARGGGRPSGVAGHFYR